MPTVRRVYDMAENGLGIEQIARKLSAEKILRPSAVAAETHANFEKYANDGKEYEWSVAMVRNILRNATYKGAVVGQKKPTISLKSKKRKGVATAETFIVEGMHEPIIEPEEWELVQSLITSRKKGGGDSEKYDNIFCGLLICPDCGHTQCSKKSVCRKTIALSSRATA
ncbi:MAG: recombinase family protein [Lachnospiraceae bacterium]|nr:recombinase family protein [Ruminococcus sp.]MCM1275570.1 recombinase family protein [Lachnospiraceae bacterium]